MGANVEPTGRLRVVQLEKEQSNSWNRRQWAHGGGSERRKWEGRCSGEGRGERERERGASAADLQNSHVPCAPSQRGVNPGCVSVSEKTEATSHGDQEKFHCLLHLPPSHSRETPAQGRPGNLVKK